MRVFRRPWTGWATLVLLLAMVVPTVSFAQGKQLEAIRKRMETGLGLFVGGKPAEAAAEFDAGYAEHPYSAFLFNAGVCYQKLGDKDKALDRYREYLKIDPTSPDAPSVQKRIAALEGQAPPPPPPPTEPGVAPPPPPPPTPEQVASTVEEMRSLVVVETEPAGAPLKVYAAADDATPAYKYGGENPGWTPVAQTESPASLSLAVGRYHIVIEKFRDFNVSETDMRVSAGHVHEFKANLSQGAFMSFLRISANVTGAHVWIDDAKQQRPEWGTTPYGELVASGEHNVRVEVPGFQPLLTKVKLEHGEQKELEVRLARVEYGVIRVDADAPEAKLTLDSEPAGHFRSGEPPIDIKVASGKHHLVVESSGRKTLDTIVDVPRGQALPLHAKLIPKFPRGAAWTQAILSGAFIGAGAFFGVESNKLYDQAKADRHTGVLDSSDSRITRGRIYAVSADAGFAAGGLLAALATYSFIRDPLPPSSSKLDKPVEFDDPRKARPVAMAAPPSHERDPYVRREADAPVHVSIGASSVGSGGGFVLGGTF